MRTVTVTIDTLRESRSVVITRAEAAAALGVDPRTITASIDNGTIPSVNIRQARGDSPRAVLAHLRR